MAHLSSLRARSAENALFTSALTAGEQVLLEGAGLETLGWVSGISIYHLGGLPGPMQPGGEIRSLSSALYEARHLAMGRVKAQAARLGADGVIGIRLDLWTGRMSVEITATGTAVRRRRGARAQAGPEPYTAVMSGGDLVQLLRGGHRPLGIVFGGCVYAVPYRSPRAWLGQRARNQELVPVTEALYTARELAMGRLQGEARSLGAHGVLGTSVERAPHSWGGHVIEFVAIGTAVAATGDTPAAVDPQMVVPLS
jgi:uncharacterized protein YbjQ (UPF0145 family)